MSKKKALIDIFIVVGRLGKSLTVTKTVPILKTGKTGRVWIFREESGFPIDGAKYVTLPNWIVKLRPAPLKRVVRFIYEPIQLLYYTIKLKPDVINGIFTLPKGLNSFIVGKVTGRKSVVSVIGGTIEITTRLPLKRFWKWVNVTMLKNTDAVTTTGTTVENFLVKNGVDREKQFTYPGCIDVEKFHVEPTMSRDIDILFVGTFRRLKGPDRILKMIHFLVEKGYSIKAEFLGSGYLFEEIQKMISDLDLSEHVNLPGYVNNPVEYFQRSKMLIMPSMSEGLPMAMLEAMACGCVPIVSDVGNITDAAHHEKNAMVIDDWSDIKSFAMAASKLLDTPTLRNQLSAAGRETVVENYSPEKQAEVLNILFRYIGMGEQKTN